MTEELVRLGHDVTLFASGDSQTAARLVPVVDGALWHAEPPCRDLVAFSAAMLGKLASELSSFDVVHNLGQLGRHDLLRHSARGLHIQSA